MAMPSKAERIHELVYSCESRTELADRIARLEELASDMYNHDMIIQDGCEYCMVKSIDGECLLDECYETTEFRQRLRQLGIDVDDGRA